jgi:hypothetical protein
MADPASSIDTLTIVQYATGFGIALGSAVAAFFGVRAKLRRSAEEGRRSVMSGGVEWYWDGPLGKVLETFQGMYREQKQAREDAQRQANENNEKLDEQTAELRALNQNMRDLILRGGRPPR